VFPSREFNIYRQGENDARKVNSNKIWFSQNNVVSLPKIQRIMRAVIQRVTHASVTIEGSIKSQIEQGFLILLGVCNEDTMEDVEWLVKKIANLRVFGDENDVMNRSILDVQGEALVVSQFTLFASYKKGNRPSWFRAGSHEHSIPLYEAFCAQLSEAIGKPVGTGEFGADMKVELLNDGPVTICMDTKNKE
jgi:D-tyrosyl-tRNA(Tyr) deacylase